MKFTAQAGAKLILSGEHSVLYHCPAISCFLPIFTTSTLATSDETPPKIQVNLLDLEFKISLSIAEASKRFANIQRRFHEFQSGQRAIQEVLESPTDLILCCLTETYQWLKIPLSEISTCIEITVQSDIPIGRGLGSSGSVIYSVVQTILQMHSVTLSQQALIELVTKIENYQHGKSSGIDVATIVSEQMIWRASDATFYPFSPESMPTKAWLIDTGAPQSSTGECVAQVKTYFSNSEIWHKFIHVTEAMRCALETNDIAALLASVAENQTLLSEIGVVPYTVNQYSQTLTQNDSAAKICGAGSVRGNSAGMMIYLGNQPPRIHLADAMAIPLTLNWTQSHL